MRSKIYALRTSGHGTCLSSADKRSAWCLCDDGWDGDKCNVTDPCQGISCNGHGLCLPSDDLKTATCSCVDGWTGSGCESKMEGQWCTGGHRGS